MNEQPTLLRGGKAIPIEEGTVLEVGDAIETRDGLLEVRDNYGLVLRLGPFSELSYVHHPQGGIVTQPAERPSLVFFGEVFKFRRYVRPLEVVACGKYRTSCWYCPANVYARNLDVSRDAFYALLGEVLIWEWDENGQPFDIVSIPEGYKAVLRHDPTQPMRNRYAVENMMPISAKEWAYMASNFMNPARWISRPREVVGTG